VICRSRTSWSRKGIQGEIQPEIQVQVSLDGKKRPVENQYEVLSRSMS
jgi:preprotein translocase subunit SecB